MTQKKIPTADTIDTLLEKGDVPGLFAKYVELTLSANRIREYLLADPALAKVLSGLVPTPEPVMRVAPPLPPWNPLVAVQQESNLAPALREPPGTIHKDIPVTYEYPMDEYMQEGAQQAVMDRLRQFQGVDSVTHYQGIDPQGEV